MPSLVEPKTMLSPSISPEGTENSFVSSLALVQLADLQSSYLYLFAWQLSLSRRQEEQVFRSAKATVRCCCV